MLYSLHTTCLCKLKPRAFVYKHSLLKILYSVRGCIDGQTIRTNRLRKQYLHKFLHPIHVYAIIQIGKHIYIFIIINIVLYWPMSNLHTVQYIFIMILIRKTDRASIKNVLWRNPRSVCVICWVCANVFRICANRLTSP